MKNINKTTYFLIYGELILIGYVEVPLPKLLNPFLDYRRYNLIHDLDNCPMKYDYRGYCTATMFENLIKKDSIFKCAEIMK